MVAESPSKITHDRQGIAAVCRHLYRQGYLAACDGNVSIRECDSIIVTPSATHKGFLEPDQLARVSLDGNTIDGTPSSELASHLAIYRSCQSAGAVVHAHPPAATAWTVAHPEMMELPNTALSELIPSVGRIPVIPYCTPGTTDLASLVAMFAPTHKVMILARHGCLCWGTTLEEAFWGVERLEHAAKTLMYAHVLGGVTALGSAELASLQQIRDKVGDSTR